MNSPRQHGLIRSIESIPFVTLKTSDGRMIKVLRPRSADEAKRASVFFAPHAEAPQPRRKLEEVAWVGKRYRSEERNNNATFLLGESFYDRERNIPRQNPSAWLVRQAALGTRRHRFYAIVEKLLHELKSTPPSPEEFWSRVAFYHFIQTPVGSSPRIAKSFTDFPDSIPQLAALMADTKPRRVIVLGKSLWRYLCAVGFVSETEMWTGEIGFPERRIRAIATQHPTAFAKISQWREHIQRYSKP